MPRYELGFLHEPVHEYHESPALTIACSPDAVNNDFAAEFDCMKTKEDD
jgi:hypothetical protein